MRKFALGAAPTRGDWRPRITASVKVMKAEATKARKAEEKEEDEGAEEDKRAPAQIPTYYPPVKGARRHERLRHHFHRNAAFLLDAWSEVVAWTAETATIPVDLGGKEFKFTPDFMVEERTHSYALRLLPGGLGRSASRDRRHEAVRAAYEPQGLRLEVLTREELEAHPELPAAKDLFYYRYWEWPDSLPFLASTLAERHAPRTLGELHRLLGDAATWEQMLSISANGHVLLDISAGLGPNTPVLACRTRGWRS